MCYRTKTTFYNPGDNSRMEGGSRNRFNERALGIQDAIRTGNPVTLAMDYKGQFGKQCNRAQKRCTLLVCNDGFDDAFPSYRGKFPNVPENCFLGIVEDTGGYFVGKGTQKLDIASFSRAHARANPKGTERSTFQVVENPCGSGSQARNCDLASRWKPQKHAMGDSCGIVTASLRGGSAPSREARLQFAEAPVRGASAQTRTGVN